MSVMNQEFSMSVNSTVRDQIRFRLSIKKKGAIEMPGKKPRKWGYRTRPLILFVYQLPDMPEEEKECDARAEPE